jgi:Holliday junction resolvase RusA-like endonuclease
MEPIRLEFRKPPSTNQLFANVPGKGRVPTSHYKQWRVAAGWELGLQWRGRAPLDYRADISLWVPGRADLDNMLKATIDLLVTMHVLHDDNRKHVAAYHIYDAPEHGNVVVEIRKAA